jgi:outer membrane protein
MPTGIEMNLTNMPQSSHQHHHHNRSSQSGHMLWAILALLASYSLQANSLLDIYQQARLEDPTFLTAQHNLKANQQQLPQAKAALMPQVTSSLNQNWPLGGSANRRYDITVSQTLQLNTLYNYKAVQQLDRNALITFKKASQALIFQTIDTYCKVLRQQNELDLAQAELRVVRQRLNQLQHQFELGIISLTTLQDTAATHRQVEIDLLQAQERHAQAIDALQLLTNNSGELTIGALAHNYPVVPIIPSTVIEWEQLAQVNNLELTAMDLTVKQAFHTYKAWNAGKYPALSLKAEKFYTYNALGLSEESDSAKISLSLSAPLYDAGLNRAQTLEAMEKWHATKQQREAILRNIKQQIRTLYRRIQTNVAKADAQQQLVDSKQLALKAKEKEQQLGLRDLVDILQAERDVFSAKQDYANTRFDYLINSMQIRQTSGILSEDDLKVLDLWLHGARTILPAYPAYINGQS